MNEHLIPGEALPEPIGAKLAAFERRRRRLAVARGAAETMCVYVGGVAMVVAMEAVFQPRARGRVWLSGAAAAMTGGWAIWRIVRPAARVFRPTATARALEAAAGGRFQERVLSALELSGRELRPGVSRWMVVEALRRTAAELAGVDTAALVDSRPAVRAARAALGAALLFFLALTPQWLRARVWLAMAPGASGAVLSSVKLAVSPGDATLRQGDSLDIQVKAVGADSTPRLTLLWSDGVREVVPLAAANAGGFSAHIPDVPQGFRYTVEAGEVQTPSYQVTVDAAPRIARVRTVITPPPLAPDGERVVDGGSADFLAGSKVRVEVETAGPPTATVVWTPEDGPPAAMAGAHGRFSLELSPSHDIHYRLQASGSNRLSSPPTSAWVLRPVADAPPEAHLAAPGSDSGLVWTDEILRLDAAASDDVALKQVDLVVVGKQGDATAQTLYQAPSGVGSPAYQTSVNRALSGFNAYPGEQVQFQLVAVDSAGQTTRSEAVTVTFGSASTVREERAAGRLRQWLAALDAQSGELREARASWLWAAQTSAPDGAAARASALSLLEGRIGAWAGQIAALAGSLTADAETNGLADARLMARLGGDLEAWAYLEKSILIEPVAAARDGAEPKPGLRARGRDRFDRAALEIAELRRGAAVLADAWEADTLAARCDAAQGRYRRGLAVLRGEAPALPAAGPGLQASFFEGSTLEGRLLDRRVAPPRFDNPTPGGRRDNWSARFEGEMLIPEDGLWTLGCAVDDGARFFVDGRQILPATAWGAHSMTTFSADQTMTAGWRPVVIEYFQGYGDARLQVLAGKKGQPLQEVPPANFRPAAPPKGMPTDATLAPLAKASVTNRVLGSLKTTAGAPDQVAPMTNDVPSMALEEMVSARQPEGVRLAAALTRFADWKPDESRAAEARADELTAMAREARRLVREELERQRWRHEGSLALKRIQTALNELRQIDQELRQEPYHPDTQQTDSDRAKIDLTKAWERQLKAAAADAAHDYFEQAKRGDSILNERVHAMAAAAKVANGLEPAVDRLSAAILEPPQQETLANRLERRIQDASEQYRQLNEIQEAIDRAQIASAARRSLPAALAFARTQQAGGSTPPASAFEALRAVAAKVEKAQRKAGEFDGAAHLAELVGEAPASARGGEAAAELRRLAQMYREPPASLAATIPPPLRHEEETLAAHRETPEDAVNQMAAPRLAMELEAARLAALRDRKAALAYHLLGRDLGRLMDRPTQVAPATIKPIADRAAALAGQKGEEARQAEIRAANARVEQLAKSAPTDPDALAAQLDALAAQAEHAVADARERPAAEKGLADEAQIAAPTVDWAEATDPKEVAAGAAQESLNAVQASPKRGEPYHDASELLAEAARKIRTDQAGKELAGLTPYKPSEDSKEPSDKDAPGKPAEAKLTGLVGRAARDRRAAQDDPAWARLNDQLRRGVRGSGVEAFSEEQQAAIRAYFQRLSANQ